MHIGIVGCGQLARMLALTGWHMALRFSFVAEGTESSACVDGLGKVVRAADFESSDALYRALGEPDVITVEREQVSLELLQRLAQHCPVMPDPELVGDCGDRLRERGLLDSLDIPVSVYRGASTAAEVADAANAIGLPVVVKSATEGYDGKAQWRLHEQDEVARFQQSQDRGSWLVESKVDFEREVSFLGARSAGGDVALYPATENRHRDGVLLTSLAPAPDLPPAVTALGRDYLTRLLTQTGYVGMLAMECFVVGERLLVNELAPRVHNSGHWTLHSEVASQFENHLRAIMGLTLGDTRLYRCEGMINILGGYDRERVLQSLPREAVLVDYNKTPAPGRKLGHITVAHRERDAVLGELERLHELLYGGDRSSGGIAA